MTDLFIWAGSLEGRVFMIHTMENEDLRVQIADKGAELISIFDKKKKREVMWQADPAFWPRHAPILFPNVGKHWQNVYRIKGKEWRSSQHGFARDLIFACVGIETAKVVHELCSNESTLESYPFAFVLRVSHSLEGRILKVCWEVENPSEETMYFAIGGHPAFALPADRYGECSLFFEGKESLTYHLIDPAGSGTVMPKTYTLALKDGCYALDTLRDGDEVIAEHTFDRDALVFDGGQIEKARVLLPDDEPYVELRGTGFSNYGIWAAPRAPFVCLEPWAGRADNYEYSGLLSEKPDINTLDAKEEFVWCYEIEIL